MNENEKGKTIFIDGVSTVQWVPYETITPISLYFSSALTNITRLNSVVIILVVIVY